MTSWITALQLMKIVTVMMWIATVSKAKLTAVSYARCPSSCSCLGNMVDCSKRKLRRLPDDLPPWAENLDISSNGIVSVTSDVLSQLESLQEINLNDNKLSAIPSNMFQNLPRLHTFKASYNRLTKLWETQQPSNITHIIIDRNLIRVVQESELSNHPYLRVLDLSFNNLVSLTNGTFPFLSNLHHLFLSNNKIESIERGALDNLMSLEWLKLNRNSLKNLQSNVFIRLVKLKTLELNRNRLRVIEGLRFQGLDGLLTLKLQRNGLVDLMDGAFWGLKKIQNLQLDFNGLTKITNGYLFGLETLQRLSLSYNRITSIAPDSWTSCKQLLEINISHNHISFITEAMFVRLDLLEQLILSHNKISYIAANSFRDLKSLTTLDLSHNQISGALDSSGEGVFFGLSSLSYLNLDANRIKTIGNDAFRGLGRLKQLRLIGNSISSIENGAFESLLNVEQLRLNTSSFLCDCHVSWLPAWLLQRGFHTTTAFACGHPLTVTGQNVLDVKVELLKCDDNYVKPSIVEDPLSHVALKDGSLNLTCQAITSSKSALTIDWEKDHIKLADGQIETTSARGGAGNNLIKFTSHLVIWPVKNDDAGQYQCVASNGFGIAYSARVAISVSVFPRFRKTPNDVTVRAGTTARLECAAVGHPAPEIAWQKDGGDDFPAARERRMHVMPSDDVFFIVDAKNEDQGVYTCTAQNDAGAMRVNATLVVLQVPTSDPKSVRFIESVSGQTTVLECTSSSSSSSASSTSSHMVGRVPPTPRLDWRKDGRPIPLTARHHFAADDQLLLITGTQPGDAGEYTCVIKTTLGSERVTSRLSVLASSHSSAGSNPLTMLDSKANNSSDAAALADAETTRIAAIIISAVVCVIGTSLVWVFVIHRLYSVHRRRRQREKQDGWSFTTTDDELRTLAGGLCISRGFHPLPYHDISLLQTTQLPTTCPTKERLATLPRPIYSSTTTSAFNARLTSGKRQCSACQCLDSGCFCNELITRPVDAADVDSPCRVTTADDGLSLSSSPIGCQHTVDQDYSQRVSTVSLPTHPGVSVIPDHSTGALEYPSEVLQRLRDQNWHTASDGELTSALRNSFVHKNLYLKANYILKTDKACEGTIDLNVVNKAKLLHSPTRTAGDKCGLHKPSYS